MHSYNTIRRIIPSGLVSLLKRTGISQPSRDNSSHLIMRASKTKLDDEYASGRWDYLADMREMPRYCVISGFCETIQGAGAILDLGCGEGVLHNWLYSKNDLNYVGVDLSLVAIEKAESHFTSETTGASSIITNTPKTDVTQFICADIADYIPDRKFKAIVFNEVLYYFDKPDEVIARYANFLEPDGRFVISLWDSAESQAAWQRLKHTITVTNEVYLRNGEQTAWRVFLCKPISDLPVSDLPAPNLPIRAK
jgi:2-polyprenyl-3-methyl-5-hydroxy-6-metoxy-1,4-benzoquinol methylase